MTDAQKWITALHVINQFKHEDLGKGFFIYDEQGFLINKDDLRKINLEALNILEENGWYFDGCLIGPKG